MSVEQIQDRSEAKTELERGEDISCVSNVKNLLPSKKTAFTLAEILIALAIIGVVAAMTMPVLVSKIGDIVLENQNKKAQSVFANGMKMLMSKDDVTKLQDTVFYQCNYDKACMKQQLKEVFKIVEDIDSTTLKDEYEFNGETKKEVWTNTQIPYAFITADGVIYGIHRGAETSNSINTIVDINGLKRPNKGGKDLCKYSVSSFGTLSEDCEAMEEFNLSECSPTNLNACRTQAECVSLPNTQWCGSITGQNECVHLHDTCSHSGGFGGGN